MAWSAVPVAVNDDCLAAQIEEIRQAIIERQNACGGTNPTQINAGDSMLAAQINNYRTAIFNLGSYFCDDTDLTAPLPLISTTGFYAYLFGKGAIESASGWTRVPTRIGPYSFGALAPGDPVYIEHVNEMKAALDAIRWLRRTTGAGTQEFHGRGDQANAVWDDAWTAAKVDVGGSATSMNGTVGRGYLDGTTYHAAVDREYITWTFDNTWAIGGTITSYQITDWRISMPPVKAPWLSGQHSNTWGGTAYLGNTVGGAVWQTDAVSRAAIIMVQPPVADLDLGNTVVYWGDWSDPDTDYKPVTPTAITADNKGHGLSSGIASGNGPTVYLKMDFSYAA